MGGHPKVGLVLGAGGVMGGAWLTGGLEALATETGWGPGPADPIGGAPAGGPAPPSLWAVACDYSRGGRGASGREDAPGAELADAGAASCAIPGFYKPVEISGRRYVDGGLWSTSNLDILRTAELDIVI